METNQINFLRDYKKCIAWKAKAGCAEMCFDFCSEEQREHCIKSQDKDNNTKQLNDYKIEFYSEEEWKDYPYNIMHFL